MSVERFEVGKTYRNRWSGETFAPTLVGALRDGGYYIESGDWWAIFSPADCDEVTPLPEVWINLYVDGAAFAHSARKLADQACDDLRRACLVHVRPDGTAEVIRP